MHGIFLPLFAARFSGLPETESLIREEKSMPRNVYSEINFHITWHTKDNSPVLVDVVENRLHHYLKHRALETQGIIVHEINGMPDHVHMAVSPTFARRTAERT